MQGAIQRVGLIAAAHKSRALEFTCKLSEELARRGIESAVEETAMHLCPPTLKFAPLTEIARNDLVIVLGGDGGLLAAAREAAPLGTPLLGVDLGSFGFLAAEDPEFLTADLDNLLAGDFEIEERVMLAVSAPDTGNLERWALNDVVIARSVHGRMIRIRTTVDGDHIATFPADGLIVATATGSTAYNLSAGGPILDSRMKAFVMTPICPHTLYSRPLLVPADVEIGVSLESDGKASEEAAMLMDGQESCTLSQGQQVKIKRAPKPARLVRLTRSRFYERLREKLRWGAER